VSYYIELPIMFVMYVGWKLWKRSRIVPLLEMDLETDVYTKEQDVEYGWDDTTTWKGKIHTAIRWLF
jgi:AAT family amino acid transporter